MRDKVLGVIGGMGLLRLMFSINTLLKIPGRSVTRTI